MLSRKVWALAVVPALLTVGSLVWAGTTIIALERRVAALELTAQQAPEPGEMGGPLTLYEVRSEIREQMGQGETRALGSQKHVSDEVRSLISDLDDRLSTVEKSAKRSEDRLDIAGIY